MQIQISWLLQKPTDLDLQCLQRQGIFGLSMTRVNLFSMASYYGASISEVKPIFKCWLSDDSVSVPVKTGMKLRNIIFAFVNSE